MIHNFIGALIEAWEEVKINKARVILSLIGVGAAVWAMSTVIALGSIVSASNQQTMAHWGGQPGTVTLTVAKNSSEGEESAGNPLKSSASNEQQQEFKKFRDAVKETARRLKLTVWTTRATPSLESIDAPYFNPCPAIYEKQCPGEHPGVEAVDPAYFALHAHDLVAGRLLTEKDATLNMNPVVINESAWETIGRPALATHPRMWLSKDHRTAVTVVGVIKNVVQGQMASIYIPADAQPFIFPKSGHDDYPAMLFLAPKGQEEIAKDVSQAVLGSILGDKYRVDAFWDEGYAEQSANNAKVLETAVAVIGGMVIALGALGLLTMSIVTVKTRVREIGIRRAVGASAKRVFFSVFLESVVATTVAGFVGVVLSVFTIRVVPQLVSASFLPGELGMVAENVAYPMQAALLGVIISAGVGALCGIIPATVAVRMRPIDAIRF